MSAAQAQWARLHQELQQNPRLRLGVWVILLVLGLYTVLVQHDRNRLAHDDYADQVDRLGKAQGLRAQENWTDLLDAERARQVELTTAFWQADTQGLAQASLQAALTEMIAPLDIRNGRIRSGLAQAVPEVPGVWQIQAQLDGSYRPGAELQLLYAIAAHPGKLVVDRLDLSRQNSRMLVLVSAYFIGIPADESG
jgi:hypothetical protein